jgi:hypothetical protein
MSNILQNARGLTDCENAHQVKISYSSCQAILTKDFAMGHLLTKFIPQLLTQQMKENCLPVTSDSYKCAETDEYSENIRTNNENSLCGYDP